MVKRGELTAFAEENGIFLKRTSRQQVYFFLFNDVLIVTRKKRWVFSTESPGSKVGALKPRGWTRLFLCTVTEMRTLIERVHLSGRSTPPPLYTSQQHLNSNLTSRQWKTTKLALSH